MKSDLHIFFIVFSHKKFVKTIGIGVFYLRIKRSLGEWVGVKYPWCILLIPSFFWQIYFDMISRNMQVYQIKCEIFKKNFTQILREINIWDSRNAKSAILIISRLWILIFMSFCTFWRLKSIKFMVFLSLRFYVKSILENAKVQKMPFLPI